jgi:hypothetical protein
LSFFLLTIWFPGERDPSNLEFDGEVSKFWQKLFPPKIEPVESNANINVILLLLFSITIHTSWSF